MAPMKEENKVMPWNKDDNSKGCWTCGGSHLAKTCPNQERVNALLARKLNQREREEEVEAAMENPLDRRPMEPDTCSSQLPCSAPCSPHKFSSSHHASFEIKQDDPTLVDLVRKIIGLRLELERFRSEISLYRADIEEHMTETFNFRGSTHEESSKVRILEPKAFGGARRAKDMENFIWDMEKYFTAGRVPEMDKLNITTMYLTDDAKLWWMIWNEEYESADRPRIDNWTKLKKEMRDQFLPSKASWFARDKLKRLRQNGCVRYYIKEFTSVMLDIQLWAIAAADSLVDFQSTRPITDVPSTSKSKKKGESKGDMKRENRKENANDKGKEPMIEENKDRPRNKDGNSKGYWNCGGPHLVKAYPRRIHWVCLSIRSRWLIMLTGRIMLRIRMLH
ncbi:hypothetical protein KY290_012883 [Solanum tuberosum]|uniref:Retrotransposon gag domain-containing protein n=1 Tax=Solanum tuberosum TaxID=4113 RepID=A0ABQ7VN37_SOLTU|nr:hypothetical protein KY285_012635 [Solanum tuberosum]KAH0768902.1 hypothetical protein KY290_012883 [Solanum tuberosum]